MWYILQCATWRAVSQTRVQTLSGDTPQGENCGTSAKSASRVCVTKHRPGNRAGTPVTVLAFPLRLQLIPTHGLHVRWSRLKRSSTLATRMATMTPAILRVFSLSVADVTSTLNAISPLSATLQREGLQGITRLSF